MGAIRPHTTDVDTKSDWDGPKAVADAPNDREVLRYMHAWVDDNGDPDAKQSYKFPHHQPQIGAPAVIAAVNNALARLPQADIPEEDRTEVERHLRKHREDAGLENNAKSYVERRVYLFESRTVIDSEKRTIEGYAAVFNHWSEDLGGFREIILPGAFLPALQRADLDVRALINHDANLILGRTKTGTLEIYEDEIGLKVRIALPDTQYARDLLVMMERGDINQMSFGFETAKDRWYEEGGQVYRELLEIGRLYDVSVVTFPAYPQTIAQARDVLNMRKDGAAQAGASSDAESSAQGRLDVKRKKIQLLKLK